MEQADRYNNGKRKWSLVDFKSIEEMVQVLEYGSKKYSAHNWKKGLPVSEIFESMLRHMLAYMDGEDVDQESNLPHTGHILCNAMFLAYMNREKKDFDDRQK
jgi:hypothetical protein